MDIYTAIKQDKIDRVKYLLKKYRYDDPPSDSDSDSDLDLDSDSDSDSDESVCYQLPMITAIKFNRVNIIKLLLKHKINVNRRIFSNSTYLIYLSQFHSKTPMDFKKIALLLLENGAWLNAKNDYGKTALDFAIINKNETLIKILHQWPLIKAQRLYRKNLARKKLKARLKARKTLEKALIIKTKIPIGLIKKIKQGV